VQHAHKGMHARDYNRKNFSAMQLQSGGWKETKFTYAWGGKTLSSDPGRRYDNDRECSKPGKDQKIRKREKRISASFGLKKKDSKPFRKSERIKKKASQKGNL